MSIKKGWKITWISLGSLLGLVILLLGVAIWIIFTPSQLTKLVNRLAGNFLDCDAHFEYVDFTLISTFPDAGLKIKNVTLVKKMEGAPNDTLAFVGEITVGIDLMAYLKDDKVIVHQVYVDNAVANLYIDKEGRCNFDIVPPSEDTTATELPALIDLKTVKVMNLTARLKDERDGMDAELCGMGLTIDGRMKDDDILGNMTLNSDQLTVTSDNWKVESGKWKVVADVDKKGSNIGATATVNSEQLTLNSSQWAVDVENLELGANIDKEGMSLGATVTVNSEQLAVNSDESSLATVLEGFCLQMKGDSRVNNLDGTMALKVDKGKVDMGGRQMVNKTLQGVRSPLLHAQIPFHYNMAASSLTLDESSVDIADLGLLLGGTVDMDSVMNVDLALRTADDWRLSKVLSYIPDAYSSFRKGMDVDGRVRLDATAKGAMGHGATPVVDASLHMDGGRYHCPSMMPYKISGVSGTVQAHLDMNKGGVSRVKVDRLYAGTEDVRMMLSGRADDLLGNMRVDATMKGSLPLDNLALFLPEDMELEAEGSASLDAHAKFAMGDLRERNFEKMDVSGNLQIREADIDYMGLLASFPEMNMAVALPAQKQEGKMAEVHISGGGNGKLVVEAGPARLESDCEAFNILVAVNDLLKEDLMAAYDIEIGETEFTMDETQVSLGDLSLKGTMENDDSGDGFLAQFNPHFGFTTHNASLFMPQLPEAVLLTNLELDYSPEMCEILSAQVKMGHTDLDLFGRVENMGDWMAGEDMLRGYLNLSSEYSDVDQMMNLFSGAGSDPAELEAMRIEDTVPADANPFIVPKNVDLTLLTQINRCVAFGNDLRDVSGELTVKDGVAVLDQMGFVCKAARMQLTAIYKSPRPNNLFTSIDFHLLDIQIDELLDMIPCVDTLVPMLKAFNGNADFHLAGETFLDAYYHPKMSSLLGSAAISGKDLVVFEDESLARTAKLIGLKSWKDDDNKIKIDSLSVEMTCFRKEIEVYPFLLNMGKYSFCISGIHNLDNLCNYHIELLKNPLIVKVGVDIKGPLSDPSISLGSVRYGDFYKPEKVGAASKKALELKNMIRRELERNVR